MKRRLVHETALSRRFEFETLEPRVLMSADLLPVHGALDAPGQINRYTFNLAAPTNLYFDSLTPNSNQIDWTLQGPQGTVVDHQSFAQSDSDSRGGTATLNLVPGNYTLSVNGQNNATGPYDFHLLDLAAAQPITVGNRVDGTLNPGNETQAYQFNGTAGETVFFDSHTLDQQSTAWRVVGPENTLVFGPTGLGQDPNTVTLERTGSYTVLIEGDVNQTSQADYSFTVFPVGNTQQALSLDATTTGNLQTPGQTDSYTFDVTQPTNVLFDSLAQRGDVTWTLTGSTGDLVSQRAFNQSDGRDIGGDPAISLAPGSYTLTVAGSNSATGLYGFRLLDTSVGTNVAVGSVQSGTIDDAGYAAQALHTSPGAPLANPTADRAFSLDDAGVNATVPNSALLQPAQVTVEAWVKADFNAGPGDIVRQGAPGAGYALLVGNDGKLQFDLDGTVLEAPTTLRQGIWTHVAATYDGTAMHLVVNGQDVADQAFAGPISYDGNGLVIGAADANGDSRWQGAIDELRVWNTARSATDIAGANGQELGPQPGLVADYHFDEASGLTLADSSGNGLDATIGNLPGTSTTLLTFDLVAGQTYFLNAPTVSGDIIARLYQPSGALLLGPESLQDHGGITATVTGTYTLALEGRIYNGSPAQYSVELAPTIQAQATLQLGATISGSVAQPSQGTAYSFTLANATAVLFDTLGADNNGLDWDADGPARHGGECCQPAAERQPVSGPSGRQLHPRRSGTRGHHRKLQLSPARYGGGGAVQPG